MKPGLGAPAERGGREGGKKMMKYFSSGTVTEVAEMAGENLTLTGTLIEYLIVLVSFLPESPFTSLMESIQSSFPADSPVSLPVMLNYLNWLIPIGPMLELTATWLFAVTVYYIYQIPLRWGRLIR